jgi:hypothetical protein
VIREAVPQDFALRAQIAMIAGDEPASSFIEVRALPLGLQEFFAVRDVSAVAEAVRRLSADHEVFIGAAPRVRESGAKEDVERVWCLWADCDSPQSVARLRAFRPMPNMVVASGGSGRLHAWWQISPSVSGEIAERGLRRLIGALDSDPSPKDCSRVMRAITSIHRKHDEQVVRCVYLDVTAHTLRDVVGPLSDPDLTERPSAPKPTTKANGSASAGALEGILTRVREARPPIGDQKGERSDVLNWAAFKLGAEVASGALEAGLVEAELLDAALAAGLSESEARRTIRSGLNAGMRQAS